MRKLIAFLLFTLLIACNNNVYYEQSEVIPEGNWSYDHTVVFEFDIDDLESYFDLILDVSHDPEYKFENVYVKIKTTFPSGEIVTDEVSLQLADDLDQWQGKCSGSSCTASILLQNRIFFKEAGKHKLEIEQFNRTNPLEGINSLDLIILRAEE